MDKINFSAPQIMQMDAEQKNSFYWNLKKSCINYLINKFHDRDGSVLDIGCGTGFVISGSNLNYKKYLGMDAFLEAEYYLKKNLSSNVRFTTLPLTSLGDEKYELILLLDVLEHIKHDHLFLRSIRELMNNRSKIILSVPAHQWLFSNADIISGHERRYSFNGINKILDSEGFEVIFKSSFLVLTLPLLVISRLYDFINRSPKNEHSGFINKLLFKLNSLDYFIFKNFKPKFGGTIVVVCKLREQI